MIKFLFIKKKTNTATIQQLNLTESKNKNNNKVLEE